MKDFLFIKGQKIKRTEEITEELKDYESKILGAEENISILENQIFNDLILNIQQYFNQ